MSDERRREFRLDTLSLGLFVYDNLKGELLGTLVNLSRSGLMMLSGAQCDPGGVLQIDLRSGSAPDTPTLPMGIKVAWVSPANTAGSYWIGARIIGISDEDREKLEALLSREQAAESDD